MIIVYQTTYRRIEILFITLALLLKKVFFSLFLTFLVKGFSRVVFSLALFNFQDAVQPPFSSGDLIIISHFIRLVKYFSEFFSKKFFKTFYVTVTALCGNFYIISHIFRFVKYFFQIFSGNFLQTFFPKSKKHFLPKFLIFPCLSVRQLYYYIMLF